jgi:pteridine reductase
MLRGMTESEGLRRVALVTGAAKRVGRAIVERLAGAGFDVALTYHASQGEAADLSELVRAEGTRVLAIRADLTAPAEAVKAIHGAVCGAFDRLDVLVNNASLYEESPLDRVDLEQTRRLWAIHVESPLLLCRAFAADLRRARGHVVNMVDLLAERPWPRYLAYCASKAGLWNLTLGLARELAPDVTVNGIAPGVVEWPDDYPEEERRKYLSRVPLARPGTPGDVADLVHFLCTGGRYVTGQVIRLDGGRSVT